MIFRPAQVPKTKVNAANTGNPVYAAMPLAKQFPTRGEAMLCDQGRPTPTTQRQPHVLYKFWSAQVPEKKLFDPVDRSGNPAD